MPKFVSFVFKVLIGALLIAMFVSIFTAIFITFTTVNRVQNLAQIVQMDIAENNCMMYDMYDAYVDQVDSILDRGKLRGLRLITWQSDVDEGGVSSKSNKSVYVYKKTDAAANKDYIQKSDSANGILAGTGTVDDSHYLVANYGDILVFETDLSVMMQFYFIPPQEEVGNTRNATTVADFDTFVFPPQGFALKYEIPALTYLK